MTTGSLKAITFQVRNVLTNKVESITIETAHSQLAHLSTGRGWAAALNGFDEGCKMTDGRTEAEAISELLYLCDFERVKNEPVLPSQDDE